MDTNCIVFGIGCDNLFARIKGSMIDLINYDSIYTLLKNAKKSVEFGTVEIDEFADGELSVQFTKSVRNKVVYLVCATDTLKNEKLLALSIEAAKNANALRVVSVLTYFGYARQDKKTKYRGSIGARVSANTLIAQGLDSAIIVELHSIAIGGIFSVPVDNIPLENILTYMHREHIESTPISVCSPDQGGVERSLKFYRSIKRDDITITTPVIIKSRLEINKVHEMTLYGDVKDRIVFLIDDIVDTAGTIVRAAKLMKEKGAKAVVIVYPHGVYSKGALEALDSGYIDRIITSDTVPTSRRKLEEYNFKNCEYIILSAGKTLAKQILKDNFAI